MKNIFDLADRTALVTGAGGLLGPKHAESILDAGGDVVLTDWHINRVQEKAEVLRSIYGEHRVTCDFMDVTDKSSIAAVIEKNQEIDILINNAAKDPKVKKGGGLTAESRFEEMEEQYFRQGIEAAIMGTFLCSQAVGNLMLKNGGGVIVNIASDLGVIAPDQRIYLKDGLPKNEQNVKPITYSAAKWAVVGMTKYLAVYFAKDNIRVNCLSPTGVFNDHPPEFVEKLSGIIPMGRMADINEYKGAINFLCSDASSYMTGENMVIDGGKTVW